MKKETMTPWLSLATLALLVFAQTASGQRLYLDVDRETGSVNAVPSADFEVDGYTITSASGLLDPTSWNSLADQGSAGWAEANPRSQQLSELNWEGAGGVGTGLELGSPYNSAGVLPSQEDLALEFSTPGGDLITGGVVYSGASQVPGITVNRESGLVEVANPLGFEITGYTITSESEALRPDSFNSLADQSVEGWEEANPSSGRLSELNLTSSTVVDAGSPFNIGNAFTPGGTEDLAFEYLTIGDEIAEGLVTYTGHPTNLTLQVDLLSGEAKIQNLSAATGSYDVIGYSVFSESGSLSVGDWNGLSDSGAGGAGWEKANPSGAAIAELNPTGAATTFDTGKSISIGNIFTGTEDLVFEFGTVDGAAFGAVEYVLGGGTTGPTCQEVADSRAIAGDLNGDDTVNFSDFLVLSTNFNQAVSRYEDGDINCGGTVDFPDFLTLSSNFNKSAGATAASVPEPASSLLGVFGMCCLLTIRRRHR